jgi:hypothetical protein
MDRPFDLVLANGLACSLACFGLLPCDGALCGVGSPYLYGTHFASGSPMHSWSSRRRWLAQLVWCFLLSVACRVARAQGMVLAYRVALIWFGTLRAGGLHSGRMDRSLKWVLSFGMARTAGLVLPKGLARSIVMVRSTRLASLECC